MKHEFCDIIEEALLDQFKARDIGLMDARAMTFLKSRPLLRPYPTFVLVKEVKIFSLLWESKDPQKKLYFPITRPEIDYFEYINPDELDVIFIGTIQELRLSNLIDELKIVQFKAFASGNPEDIVALINPNHEMYGENRKPMHFMIFPCTVDSRVKDGILFTPRPYTDLSWTQRIRDMQERLFPCMPC